MPTAAYCMECGTWVWVSPDGGCSGGHARSNLRSLHESPSVAGQPVPPNPPAPNGKAVTPVNAEYQIVPRWFGHRR